MPEPVQTEIGRIKDPVERLCAFIRAREELRRISESARAEGKAGYAFHDDILRTYRFCNVRREDDRVTKWIDQNWRQKYKYRDVDTWFAMVVARFINWPDTLDELGYPCPWNGDHFIGVMSRRKAAGEKVYSGAYMVRAEPDMPGQPKYLYQKKSVFDPMWAARDRLRPKEGDTLNSYHMLLGQFHGLGSFMAAQVVADLKYVSPLDWASDWVTFAASGPGSRRGLNRVLGRPVKSPWTEEDWRERLYDLHLLIDNRELIRGLLDHVFHAQDLQNCLCEFDKYERVRLGEGRPRALYRPT